MNAAPGADPTVTPPHRPTPTERLHEVTMAALNRRPAEPESSVTLTRNAKGDVQFEVTVRGPDAAGCEELAAAIADRLAAKYPRASPPDGAA